MYLDVGGKYGFVGIVRVLYNGYVHHSMIRPRFFPGRSSGPSCLHVLLLAEACEL